jgi:hypothetical protein
MIAAGAGVASLSRVVLGLIAIGLAAMEPEANVVALFDLPTIFVYALVSKATGLELAISTAADPRFFVAGTIVWALMGGILAALLIYVGSLKRRRA